MARDGGSHETPTRRDYVKYSGAVIGGGLWAGCTSDSSSGDGKTKTTGETTDESDARTVKTTDSDGSYTTTVEPVGMVEFESVPERWSNPGGPAYLDMGIVLGQLDGLVATGSGLFPDVFGADAERFDRQRVRDIVNRAF